MCARWQVDLDEAAALQRMTAAAPALLRWLGTYLSPTPGPSAVLDIGYGGGGPPQQPVCIQVSLPDRFLHRGSSWFVLLYPCTQLGCCESAARKGVIPTMCQSCTCRSSTGTA